MDLRQIFGSMSCVLDLSRDVERETLLAEVVGRNLWGRKLIYFLGPKGIRDANAFLSMPMLS